MFVSAETRVGRQDRVMEEGELVCVQGLNLLHSHNTVCSSSPLVSTEC